MDCLDNIIGLSQIECECQEPPEGYNVSRSGIFLDRLDGFNIDLADSASECANGEIWERMYTAIEDAKIDYRTDLMGCVARTHKPRLNNFSGQLGQSTWKNTLNITSAFAGMRLNPAPINGGYITVNKIGIIVNQAVPVTVKIYSDENDSTLVFSSTPIVATADLITWATLTTPLELPMVGQDGGHIHYYVLLVMDGTFQPKDNKSSCGCGNDKKKAYNKWLTFDGVHGNNIGDVNTFSTSSNLVLNGIALNVDLNCKISEIVCSEEHPLDFLNDGNAMSMAYAIRFRAGVKLYEAIQATGNINRYSLLKAEHVANKIREWTQIYQDYILDTCKNTNRLNDNDCLVCRDTQGTILKRGIVVTNNVGYEAQWHKG